MKKLTLLLSGIFICTASVMAQESIAFVDGQYLNQNNQLYSGPFVTYHDNKTKEASYSLEKGELNGEAQFFYENGLKQEIGFYANGKKHGTWIKWDQEGNKVGKVNFINGKKNGEWTIWDKNGQKRYEMHYKDGEKDGEWKIWDENGNLASTKKY